MASKGRKATTLPKTAAAGLSDFGQGSEPVVEDDEAGSVSVVTEKAPLLSPKKAAAPRPRNRDSVSSTGAAKRDDTVARTKHIGADVPTAGRGDKVIEHALSEFDQLVASLPQSFTSDQMALLRLHVNKRLDQLLDDHTVPIPQSQIIDAPITLSTSSTVSDALRLWLLPFSFPHRCGWSLTNVWNLILHRWCDARRLGPSILVSRAAGSAKVGAAPKPNYIVCLVCLTLDRVTLYASVSPPSFWSGFLR